ncbi:MAG: MFS transporter [Sphingorhabdus sp.]
MADTDPANAAAIAGLHGGRVPLHIKLFHGLGSAAYGIKENGFSTFLLLFYNQVIGLDAWMVSLALALAMVIDGFVDPLIGHYSDRTYTRWGKRLPWLYIAPIPLAIAWMLLWMPPSGLGDATLFYLLATAVMVRILVSACEVPSAALIPELSTDYDERTAILRFRYLFAWIAGLGMLYLAYDVFLVPDADHPVGQLNAAGYWNYGLCGAIIMAAMVLISAMGQHRRVAHLPAVRPAKISAANAFSEIRESLTHPAAIILLCGAFFMFISQGVTFAISNYLYIFVWKFSQGAFALYPLLLLLSVVGSFFLVTPLTRRFGKPPVVIVSGLIGMAFWITPFIFNLAGIWPTPGSFQSTALVFAFAFCSNTLSVMAMITGQSMVTDIVEASQIETGRRAEGVFSAGWFFTQKCGVGAGILISGLIISLSGLSNKAAPGSIARGVLENLMLSYISIIALLAITTAFIIRRFPINRTDHEDRIRKLGAATTD